MEPKEAPAEASVPNLKGIQLSVSMQGRSRWSRKFFVREGKESPSVEQEDAPCATLQSKAGPDFDVSGAVSQLGAWAPGKFQKCRSLSVGQHRHLPIKGHLYPLQAQNFTLLFPKTGSVPWEWIHVNKPEATPSAGGKSFLSCSYITALSSTVTSHPRGPESMQPAAPCKTPCSSEGCLSFRHNPPLWGFPLPL